ncbi:hypothetical protein EX30DRAFT_339322 [Ascodesmis nigricans]|uniref:Uncharacterized protein n=1 Tax=Ascodesmis nigricans TaxID=341454 RepID=A0A4S2N1X2_9PEZI|nr:hypothetical protein EX30DRAFT_339322 [Ascodesmis nigricans]
MSFIDEETNASMATYSASAVAAFDTVSSSSAGKTYTLHCHCKANIYIFGPIDDI